MNRNQDWLSGLPAHLAARRRLTFNLARIIGAVAAFSTLTLAYLYYAEKTKPGPESPVARYTVDVKQGLVNIFWPRISPDGQNIAFHADDSLGTNRIWVRPMNSLEAYPLLNTEDASRFFWSPDGRHIAFFINNQLKRISISGGQAQLICQGPNGADGSWGNNDLIVFDGSTGDTMKIVPAGGGQARPATLVDTTTVGLTYSWPWFLPDGKHFLFTTPVRQDSGSTASAARLKLGNIDSTNSIALYDVTSADRIEYSNEGYVLYVEQDNLMGLPFDADKLEVTGEPKPIAMNIGTAGNTYAFSVSDNGTLLYQSGNRSSVSELVWVDRTGKRIETVGQQGRYGSLEISPDETRVAYTSVDEEANASNDIWIYDLRRNVPTRLTFDPADEGGPLWSPDGQYVYFMSVRDGQFYNIYRKAANGLGDAELVYKTDTSHVGPYSFTPDGTRLVFGVVNASWDIGILHMSDSNRVDMFANSSFFEGMAAVSPNGEYVAYVSEESGRREVYVGKLDGSGGKWQISTENAENPHWRQDGGELFYLTMDNQIMAVKVESSGDFRAENPIELFELRFQYPGYVSKPLDASDDGQRFLVNVKLENSDPGEIVVVQNWAEEFKDN